MGNNYVSWNITDDFDDWITNEDGSVSYEGKLYKNSDELRDFLRTATFTINDYAISDTILKYSDGAWDSTAKGMEYVQTLSGKYIIELSPSFYEVAFKKKSPTGTVAFNEDYLKLGTWSCSKEGTTLTINTNGTWSMSGGQSGTYEFNKRAIIFNLYENGELSEAAWDYSYINTPTSGSNGETLVGGAAIHCCTLFLQNHKLEYEPSSGQIAKWVTHTTETDDSSYGKYNKYVTCGHVYNQQNFDTTPVYSTYVRFSFQVLQRCYFVYDTNADEIYIALTSTGGSSYKFGTPTKYAGDKLYSWQNDDGNNVRLQRLVFSSDSAKGGIITAAEGSTILKYVDVYSYQVADGNLQTGWNYNRYGNWIYNNGQSSYLNLTYLGPTSFKKFKSNTAIYSSKWSIPSSYSALDNKVITLPFQQTSIMFPVKPGYTIHTATYSSNNTTKSITREAISYLSETYREIDVEGTKEAVTLELNIVERTPEVILYDGENAAAKYSDSSLFTTDLINQTDSGVTIATKTASNTFGQTKLAAYNNVRFQPGSYFISHDAEHGTVTINPSLLGLNHDVCCSTNLDVEYNFTLTYTDVSDWNQNGHSELPKAMLLFCSCDGYQEAITYSSFNTYSFVSGDEIVIIFEMSTRTNWTKAEDYAGDGDGESEPWHLKILDSTLIPVGSSIKNVGEVSPWVTTNADGSSFLFWDFGLDFIMPGQNYDLNVYLTDRLYKLSLKDDPFEGIKSTNASSEIENYFWIMNTLYYSLERYAYINLNLTKLKVNSLWKDVSVNVSDDFFTHDVTQLSGNNDLLRMSSNANSQSKRNFSINVRTQGTEQTLLTVSSMYTYYAIENSLYSEEFSSNYPGYYRCIATGGNTGNGGAGGNGGQSVAAISWKQGMFAMDWWFSHHTDTNMNKILQAESQSPVSLNPVDTLSRPGGKGGDGFVGGDGGNGGDAYAGGIGMQCATVPCTIFIGLHYDGFYLGWPFNCYLGAWELGGDVSFGDFPGFIVFLSGGIGGDGGNGGDGWLLPGRGGGSGGGTNGLPKGSFGAIGGCDSSMLSRWSKLFNHSSTVKYMTSFKLQKYRGCLFDAVIANKAIYDNDTVIDFANKTDYGLSDYLDCINQLSSTIQFKVYVGRSGTDGSDGAAVPAGMFGMCGTGGAGGTPTIISISSSKKQLSWVSSLGIETEAIGSRSSYRGKLLLMVAEGGTPGSSYTYQTGAYNGVPNSSVSCADVYVPTQVESGNGVVLIRGRYSGSKVKLIKPLLGIGAGSGSYSYGYWESNCAGVNCCYARVAYLRSSIGGSGYKLNDGDSQGYECFNPTSGWGEGCGWYGSWSTNCIHEGSDNTTLYYGWDVGCGCCVPLESPFGVRLAGDSNGYYASSLATNHDWLHSYGTNPQKDLPVERNYYLKDYLMPRASVAEALEALNYPYYSIGAKTIVSSSSCGQVLVNGGYLNSSKKVINFLYSGNSTAYVAAGTEAYYGAAGLASVYLTRFKAGGGYLSGVGAWSASGSYMLWATHDRLWDAVSGGNTSYSFVTLKQQNKIFSNSFVIDGSVWPWCGAGSKVIYLGYNFDLLSSGLYTSQDPAAV